MFSRLIYLLFTPILLLFSVPLVFFAALTSAFAFTTLLIRVGIVYFELFVSITHNYFTSNGNGARDSLLSSRTTSSKTETTATTTSPHRKHHNRQSHSLHSFSSHYTSSNNTATVRSPNGSSLSSPISPNLPPPSPSSFAQGPPNYIHINNLNHIPPSPSLLLTTRDFEGVGGWRFQNSDSGDEDDDKWSNLNSRLELPTRGTGTGTLTGYSTPELRRKGYGQGFGYGKGRTGEQKPQPQHRRSLPGGTDGGLGLSVAFGGGSGGVGGGGGGRKLGFRSPEGMRSRARTPGVEKGDPMDGTGVKRASKSYVSLAEAERKIWRG